MSQKSEDDMSYLDGIRVVRGPDWKWGDQDGGEGNAGTVYMNDSRHDDMDMTTEDLQPGMVFVVWDANGIMDKYRCGHQGFYDLRVIDNAAAGVKHPNIPCDGANCSVKEICGIRWQCAACDINFCTNCYLKEIPHHPDHNQYKRYDDDNEIDDAPVVFGWSDDGPQSRLKLMGIYPGAKVIPNYYLDEYQPQQRPKTGLVLPNPDDADALDVICVEWDSGPVKNVKVRRCSPDQELSVKIKEPAIVGFYNSGAFSVLDTIPDGNDEGSRRPEFSPGDLVDIQLEKLGDVKLRDVDTGKRMSRRWMEQVFGEVKSVSDTDIRVHFDYFETGKKDALLDLNPSYLNKLNEFSLHETIQIKNDIKTSREIREMYNNLPFELAGEVGRVSFISTFNIERFDVHFDNKELNEWFSKHNSSDYFPSSWLERVEMCVDKELDELTSKTTSLFYDAVRKGDLRTVKLIISHKGLDVNECLFIDLTALQLAIKEGQKEIVQFIIDQPQTDLEKKDGKYGYRAIHYAVIRCNLEILEMLIKKGINLDRQAGMLSWVAEPSPPLQLALSNKHLECCRLLIQNGCNVDFKFKYNHLDGQTSLHYAIIRGISPDIIKLLVTKLLESQTNRPDQLEKLIDTKNRSGQTTLLLACQKKDYSTIELLVEAGADVNTVDKEGNTAIILAISSLEEDAAPKKELSPSICKFWQNAKDGNEDLLEIYPILSLLGYLLKIGCCWETANKAGKKAVDILLEKGYSNEVLELLNETAAQYKRWPYGPKGCVGQNGECAQLPVYRLTCPHKPTFRACSECYPLIFKQHRCRCDDEEVNPIKATQRPQDSADLVARTIKQEAAAAPPDEARNRPEDQQRQPEPLIYALNWINGPDMGFVEDQVGNKYTTNGQTRKDGSLGYRCCHKMMGAYKEERCPAVARRFFNTENGVPLILLQEPHRHRLGLKRSSDGGTQSGETPGPSGAKKQRSCADETS